VEQYVLSGCTRGKAKEGAVQEALRDVTGPSRQEPGCLTFHTFRSMRGSAAIFHSFAMGGRRRISETRGIATYSAIPRTRGCAPRSATGRDQDRAERVMGGYPARQFLPTWRVLPFTHKNLGRLAGNRRKQGLRSELRMKICSGAVDNCQSNSL